MNPDEFTTAQLVTALMQVLGKASAQEHGRRLAASEGFDFDSLSGDKHNEYESRAMQTLGHLGSEEHGRRLATSEGVDFDSLSGVKQKEHVRRAKQTLGHLGGLRGGHLGVEEHGRRLAASEGFDYDALSEDHQNEYISGGMRAISTKSLPRGRATCAASVVTRREGEEAIWFDWRDALESIPGMTESKIDDFIAAPTDIGKQRSYSQLLRDLYMRAARASADVTQPDGCPPLSDAEWRTMQSKREWVRRATQTNLPKDEALERAQHVLSMLKTLSHTDIKSYIGWTIKSRATMLKSNAAKQEKRKSNKKDKRQ